MSSGSVTQAPMVPATGSKWKTRPSLCRMNRNYISSAPLSQPPPSDVILADGRQHPALGLPPRPLTGVGFFQASRKPSLDGCHYPTLGRCSRTVGSGRCKTILQRRATPGRGTLAPLCRPRAVARLRIAPEPGHRRPRATPTPMPKAMGHNRSRTVPMPHALGHTRSRAAYMAPSGHAGRGPATSTARVCR